MSVDPAEQAAAAAPSFRPPPDPCCLLGAVYFDGYARAARQAQADPGRTPLVVSQLVEVVDHLVTHHDAGGRTSDRCAGCLRFAGEPPAGMTAPQWALEIRAHQVAHTVIDGGPLLLDT